MVEGQTYIKVVAVPFVCLPFFSRELVVCFGCMKLLSNGNIQNKQPMQKKGWQPKSRGRRSMFEKPESAQIHARWRSAPCAVPRLLRSRCVGTCGRLCWPSPSPACALPARPECVAPPRRARHRDVRRALQPLSVVVRRCLLVHAPSHHHATRRGMPRDVLRVLGCW